MLAVTHIVKGKHNPAMQKGISLASNLVQHGLHVQYVKYCRLLTCVLELRTYVLETRTPLPFANASGPGVEQ